MKKRKRTRHPKPQRQPLAVLLDLIKNKTKATDATLAHALGVGRVHVSKIRRMNQQASWRVTMAATDYAQTHKVKVPRRLLKKLNPS